MLDINMIIDALKRIWEIFHSEDDLKQSFGMEILREYNDCEVRLERPIDIDMISRSNSPNNSKVRAPFDIVIIDKDGQLTPIELKYKTKKVQLRHKDEL